MMVKQDIAQLNGKLDQLTKLRDTHSSSKQVVDHSTNVVNQLKSSLMTTTQSFQEVLKTRTDSMQAQQDRRQQFLGTQAQSRARPSPFQANGHSSQSASSVAIDLGSGSAGAEEAAKGGRNNALSLSLMEARPEQGYQQARADAVRQVESTIVELGQIFNQLATMVAEQGEMVERIDANVEDTTMNVNAAHMQLMKYYNGLSSNRGLIIKVFATVLIFLFIWVFLA